MLISSLQAGTGIILMEKSTSVDTGIEPGPSCSIVALATTTKAVNNIKKNYIKVCGRCVDAQLKNIIFVFFFFISYVENIVFIVS